MRDSSSSQTVSPMPASNAWAVSRPSGETRRLATSAVMPLPMAAGVLGMVLTTGVSAPKRLSNQEMVFPATMETASVCRLTIPLQASATSSIVWGLTAKTIVAGSTLRGTSSITVAP